MFVPAETRSVELLALVSMALPTLCRILWFLATGLRRGEMESDCESRTEPKLPLRREPRRKKS